MWQVSISTTAQAEDAVACLLQRDFQKPASVYCDEATGATSVTIYPQRLPRPVRAVRAHLRGALRQLEDCGLDFGSGKITVKPLPRQNWADSWKRHFKPVEIGRFLLIKPGWSRRRPRQGQRVVILDPGLSFGTGHHPTTFFCLQQLARCRRPGQRQSFLDIGTGSESWPSPRPSSATPRSMRLTTTRPPSASAARTSKKTMSGIVFGHGGKI